MNEELRMEFQNLGLRAEWNYKFNQSINNMNTNLYQNSSGYYKSEISYPQQSKIYQQGQPTVYQTTENKPVVYRTQYSSRQLPPQPINRESHFSNQSQNSKSVNIKTRSTRHINLDSGRDSHVTSSVLPQYNQGTTNVKIIRSSINDQGYLPQSINVYDRSNTIVQNESEHIDRVLNMNIDEVKGTDRVFKIKIESLENRCRQLENQIKILERNGDNMGRIRELSELLRLREEEIQFLKEENAKLKNLADDELVMVEKVELKEIYGKKQKVEEMKRKQLEESRWDEERTSHVIIQQKNSELIQCRNQISQLESEVSYLKSELQKNPKIIRVEKSEQIRTEDHIMNESHIREQERVINDLRNQINDLKMQNNEYYTQETVIKTLKNEIGGKNHLINTLRSELNSITSSPQISYDTRIESTLRDQIRSLQSDLNQIKNQNFILESENETLKMDASNDQDQFFKNQLKKFQTEINNLKNQNFQLENQNQNLQRQLELESQDENLRNQIRKLQQEITQLKHQNFSLESSNQDLKRQSNLSTTQDPSLRESLNQYQIENQNLKHKNLQIEGEIDLLKRQLKIEKAQNEENINLQNQLRKLQSENQSLKYQISDKDKEIQAQKILNDTLKQNTPSLSQEIQNTLKEFQNHQKSMLDEKNKVISQYKEKLEDSERDLKRLREENDQLREERNELLRKKMLSQNGDEENENLRKQILKLEYDLKYKNDMLNKDSSSDDLRNQLKNKENELDDLKRRFENLQRKENDLNQRIRDLERENLNLNNDKNILENKNQNLKNKVKESSERVIERNREVILPDHDNKYFELKQEIQKMRESKDDLKNLLSKLANQQTPQNNVQKEYIKEIVEKQNTQQSNLEPLLKDIFYELKGLKDRDLQMKHQVSYNQLDQTHSRIDDGRIRDELLEVRINNENLKRQIEDQKDKINKLERTNERLQDKIEVMKPDSQGKYEYREFVKELPPLDDNKDLIFNLQQENNKLRKEKEQLEKELDDLRAIIIKKKRSLLIELANFVNSKNTFEKSFHSELTKNTNDQINQIQLMSIRTHESFIQSDEEIEDIAPWLSESTLKISSNKIKLHNELIDFYQYFGPNNLRSQQRLDCFKKLVSIFKNKGIKGKFKWFGSTAVELYTIYSDIDVVYLNPQLTEDQGFQFLKNQIFDLFFKNLEIIEDSKIKLIKFTFEEFNFDICVNQTQGLDNNEIINRARGEFIHLQFMVIFLKIFLKIRKIHKTYEGGCGSFLLFCMVWFSLKIQTQNSYTKDLSLTETLLSFFKFYGTFQIKNYQISLTNFDIQPKSSNYNGLVILTWTRDDIGKGCFKIYQLQKLFKKCHKFLNSFGFSKNESILAKLINPNSTKFVNLMNNQFLQNQQYQWNRYQIKLQITHFQLIHLVQHQNEKKNTLFYLLPNLQNSEVIQCLQKIVHIKNMRLIQFKPILDLFKKMKESISKRNNLE